jgi:hypothetical protein
MDGPHDWGCRPFFSPAWHGIISKKRTLGVVDGSMDCEFDKNMARLSYA